MKNADKWALTVCLLAILAIAPFVLAWPFRLIWNYAIVQALSIANPIGYWPAFWLVVFLMLFANGSRSKSE